MFLNTGFFNLYLSALKIFLYLLALFVELTLERKEILSILKKGIEISNLKQILNSRLNL